MAIKTAAEKRLKAKDNERFVMKNRDCEKWIAKITPMEQTENPLLARRFSARWIKNTCWNWEIFYEPVSVTKHAKVMRIEAGKARPTKTKGRRKNCRKAHHP